MAAWPLRTPTGAHIMVVNVDAARNSRLVSQAKELDKAFRRHLGKGGFTEVTNQRSLTWIQNQAVENLRESMARNRRPDFNTGRLERAITNNKYSNATPTHVQFFIRARIFPDVPYYASLEFGDRSQVGKERWFSFRGVRGKAGAANFSADSRRNFNRAHKPSDVRNNRRPNELAPGRKSVTHGGAGRVSDRIIGPREYKSRLGKSNAFSDERRVRVIIRRPVPRYAYGTRAGDMFLQRRQYKTILIEASRDFSEQFRVPLR
jgi:hypothetical protein